MSMVEWKKLGEVCGIFDGTHQTPKYTDSGIKFVSVENINDLYNSNKYISEEDYNANYKTKPQRNDVLMTRIGDVGSCAIVDHDEPLAYYVSLALLRPAPNVISGYIKYFLGSHIGKVELRKRTLLTAVPLKINLGDVGKVCIPIPSLSEQQRIVGILDTFTSSIENLKEQIAQRRKQYEYYRDQLLDLEGKEGVEMKTLGEVCDSLSGFPFDSSMFKDEGIQLMRGANVKRGYFDFTPELNKFWESSEGLEKYLLEANDIIISMDGSLVGRSFCYLKKEHLPLLLVQRVARLRAHENYKYVYYNITKSFPDYVDKKKTAGAIPHISMKDINSFTIPLPPLSEQSRIVSILDTFEASIRNLEEQLAQRQKQYEYYRNKLLTFE